MYDDLRSERSSQTGILVEYGTSGIEKSSTEAGSLTGEARSGVARESFIHPTLGGRYEQNTVHA